MNWPEDFINKIICGDCLEVMKKMPDGSVDMAITSPPYWGLRDYGFEQIFGGDPDCEHDFGIIHRRSGDKSGPHGPGSILGPTKHAQHDVRMGEPTKTCHKCQAWKGQLGLEPTPEMYIEHLAEIFNEVKRVLKKEGTFWLNMGDTYTSTKCGNAGESGGIGSSVSTTRIQRMDTPKCGLPQKCLCMIPERLAWSLIQNGWILRNKNIWHKRNAMPSSVTDRFSNTYEFVFMFSKSQRYYFDLDAVREPHENPEAMKQYYQESAIKNASRFRRRDSKFQLTSKEQPNRLSKDRDDIIYTKHDIAVRRTGNFSYIDPLHTKEYNPLGKNPGDLFEISTQPFPEAHFAVFPEKLCEKPIKAGCPEEVCKKCGKARERIVEGTSPEAFNIRVRDVKEGRIKHIDRVASNDEVDYYEEGVTHTGEGRHTVGWTSCNCNAGFEGGIVLDPFVGAGTALYVAKQLRRRFIGIDIKQEYCDMCEERLAQGVL